jgi:hypothetical protein
MPSEDIWKFPQTFLVAGAGVWVLLESSGNVPGVLLNISQHAGHPPETTFQAKINIVKVKQPCYLLKDIFSHRNF